MSKIHDYLQKRALRDLEVTNDAIASRLKRDTALGFVERHDQFEKRAVEKHAARERAAEAEAAEPGGPDY